MIRRLLWALGSIVALFVLPTLIGLLLRSMHLSSIAVTAVGEVEILLIGLGCALFDGDGVRGLGLRGSWKGYDPAVIVTVLIAHYAISILSFMAIAAAGQNHALDGRQITHLVQSFNRYQPGPFLLMMAGLTLLVGLAEEVLFRGYLISRLEQAGLPGWACVLLSAALFAVVHVPGFGVLAALPKIGIGLLLGTWFWYRRSLGPLVITHMLIDFSAFALTYLAGTLGAIH